MAGQTHNIDDNPIARLEDDKFILSGLIKTLARSIRNMQSPHGVVIALNGEWGSGKTSALNLLKRNLEAGTGKSGDAETPEIKIMDFNPWWFRGEEALVLGFLQQLYAAIDPVDDSKKLKNILAGLFKIAGNVAPFAGLALGDPTGTIGSTIGKPLGAIGDYISKKEETVEQLHKDLSLILEHQNKRLVIMIDDIDRLAREEMIAMFRLVKLVGRLPNLIYILAFDRKLAETVIAERFPSAGGSNFLEKIIQVTFDMPVPLDSDLDGETLSRIYEIIGKNNQDYIKHMFDNVVAYELKTPRDMIRYINTLAVTYPGVKDNVDPGDFIVIEAWRLFQPRFYNIIRSESGKDRGGVKIIGSEIVKYPEQSERIFGNPESEVSKHYFDCYTDYLCAMQIEFEKDGEPAVWKKRYPFATPEYVNSYFLYD